MAGIFISYRRADSDGWAGRLRDALRMRFGDRVFQDVESIADGEIFSEVIDRALQECDVALVIIGPNWARASDASGPRLHQADDWVRTETRLVLNRKIRVIPVLVGGATMPRAEDLPEELRSLTQRQAREIRSNSWDSDVALLTNHLKQIVGASRKRPVWAYAAASVAVVAGLGVLAATQYFSASDAEKSTASAGPAAGVTAPHSAPSASQAAQRNQSIAADAPPTANAAVEPPPRPAAPSAVPAPVSPPPSATTAVASSQPPAAPAAAEKPTPKTPEAAPSKTSRGEPPPQRLAAAPPKAAPAPAQPEKEAAASTAVTQKKPAAAPPAPRAPAPSVASAEVPGAPSMPAAAATAAAEAAPAASAAPPVKVARAAINLPSRPASARELKVGDSWTYRLREMQFNKNLATVTHEIGGGDKAGIRELVRAGGKVAEDGAAGTPRRLVLQPRIYEQQINNAARLVEFAPFMAAYSELKPGVKWSTIAGATSADSTNDWRFSGKVTGRERVRVPAGSFDAIKAELEGELELSFPSSRDPFNETEASQQTYTVWFVPEVGRAVKYERRTYNRGRRLLDHEQYELVSYQLK